MTFFLDGSRQKSSREGKRRKNNRGTISRGPNIDYGKIPPA
jgi:hypothetical protein